MPKASRTDDLSWISRVCLAAGVLASIIASAESPHARAVTAPGPSALAPGEVWQCMVDGGKIFSDSKCGPDASIRRLNDVNRMEPAQPFYPSLEKVDAPHPPERDGVDTAETVYSAQQVVVIDTRPRHGHTHKPHARGHGIR